MKTIITAPLIVAAALSLAACSKSEAPANTTTADLTINESDLPPIDNFSGAEAGNAGDANLTAIDNGALPLGNAETPLNAG
jgi:hypothetical protein